MAYCGLCDTHDVKLTYSKEGIECSNCGFDYHESLEMDNAERSLRAIKSAKSNGWKLYPNDKFLGKPIDEALQHAEARCKSLGCKV